MSRTRWRVGFTTVMGRCWADYRTEEGARAAYRLHRREMWGEQAVLLREDGDKFVQVAP